MSAATLAPLLAPRRIHWLSIRDVTRDLLVWYAAHPARASLRHTLVGDLFHLLVGFCGWRAGAPVLNDDRGRTAG